MSTSTKLSTKFNPAKAAALAALRHKVTLAAVCELADACLPPLTMDDTAASDAPVRQTNPPTAVRSTPHRTAVETSAIQPQSIHAAAVDAGLQPLTPGDVDHSDSPIHQTNPRSDRSLTSRHLAAARLLAAGHKPADVAAELRITRQGLWKWRRSPAFLAELHRLHNQLAQQLSIHPKALRGDE